MFVPGGSDSHEAKLKKTVKELEERIRQLESSKQQLVKEKDGTQKNADEASANAATYFQHLQETNKILGELTRVLEETLQPNPAPVKPYRDYQEGLEQFLVQKNGKESTPKPKQN